jgi:GNAT superfamily N-acetyltransferase
MIRKLTSADFNDILRVVDEAAVAYRGVIPADRWKEPYMPAEELREEVAAGVEFYGYEENGEVVGVMGIQKVRDVTLIRHAYVLTRCQRIGVGAKLLRRLLALAKTSDILVGTWEVACWAIRFYEKHGFQLTTREDTNRLLKKYWNIPERQVETSVVLKLSRHG